MSIKRFQINAAQVGLDVQTFLSGRIRGIGPRRIEVALHRGLITLNGLIIRTNTLLNKGDVLEFEFSYFQKDKIFPEAILLDIVYEDEDLIVVHKHSGMACHAGLGVYSGTLLNALAFHFQNQLGEVLPNGLVHRLDRGTSGLMVVAKTTLAFHALSQQVNKGELKRRYFAASHALPKENNGTIDAPIGRNPEQTEKIEIRSDGKKAITHYKLLSESLDLKLFECQTEFGRTHQVRIHMASIGAPLLGDQRYGGKNAERLHLCASFLSFYHPKDGHIREYRLAQADFL